MRTAGTCGGLVGRFSCVRWIERVLWRRLAALNCRGSHRSRADLSGGGRRCERGRGPNQYRLICLCARKCKIACCLSLCLSLASGELEPLAFTERRTEGSECQRGGTRHFNLTERQAGRVFKECLGLVRKHKSRSAFFFLSLRVTNSFCIYLLRIVNALRSPSVLLSSCVQMSSPAPLESRP